MKKVSLKIPLLAHDRLAQSGEYWIEIPEVYRSNPTADNFLLHEMFRHHTGTPLMPIVCVCEKLKTV